MFKKIFNAFSKDIGIDLGTANTLVYVRGRGIVINEPSVVAINQKTGKILAVGAEAKKMIGRTPEHIVASRPLREGVVSDFEVTEQMLKYFIDKVHRETGFKLFPRTRVVIGVPLGVTEVERRAVEDATKNAGAHQVFLIEEPMAAAIGARLPIYEAGGNVIVDIGGGTSEVAVISLGGVVVSKSLRIAGDRLNQDIIRYGRENFNLLLGERTAEDIKINIASATELSERLDTVMRGRDLVSGLPREILVYDHHIREALFRSLRLLASAVRDTLEQTPPELIADIMQRGIVLAGGGSLVRGLDQLIQQQTKMPVRMDDDPLTTVVRGMGVILENLDNLSEVLSRPGHEEPPKV